MITTGTIQKVMTKREAAIQLTKLIRQEMPNDIREAIVMAIGALMFEDIDSDPSYVTYSSTEI